MIINQSQNINNFTRMPKIRTQKEVLMKSLLKYFGDKEKLDRVIPISSGKSNLSLRLLDWLVTNFSKKNGTSYLLKKSNGKIIDFIIYIEYKGQLDGHSKKKFDVFCRGERITLLDHNDNEIETTVGQLNFFRWAIDKKVLDYATEHLKEIELDMTKSLKNKYKKKGKNQERRKRTTLSVSATKSIKKYNVSIVVDFD